MPPVTPDGLPSPAPRFFSRIRLAGSILAALGLLMAAPSRSFTVLPPASPPHADRLLAAHRRLAPSDTEFVLFYFRPDGDYARWNTWLWSDRRGGGKIPFTGIEDGIAYLRLAQDEVAGGSGRVNFIIRTDEWVKDPGPDQSWDMAGGNACAVISGDPAVHPVADSHPRLLSAVPVESSPGRWAVHVRTLGALRIDARSSALGFKIGGGLRIASAEPATRPIADEFLLTLAGRIPPHAPTRVSHPSFAGALDVTFPPEPEPAPPLSAATRRRLPEPILEDHPDWIDLYWEAWRFMREKITRGDIAKGFVPLYIDEGFNENIFQWDSCFMAAYAIYGLKVFPAMAALDNFYNHQRSSDGYICRCYNELTGLQTGEADINPPLFAWIEWKYWRVTGDSSRLARVLPVLDRYFEWCRRNARGERGNGCYFITDLGSGMDNSPREEFVRRGAWVDLTAQQALAALSIARLARVAGEEALAEKYDREHAELKALINSYLWHEQDGNYFDRTEAGEWHLRRTIASFWPMTAEVAQPDRAAAMIERHLKNPAEFRRPHLFPTLAANDPVYNGSGHYWRGGVWAPTNYAVIKGIERTDRTFATEAAENHIEQMSRVYHSFKPSPEQPLPPLTEPNIPRNGDGIRQLWEAYSPEDAAPATRWDARQLVRQKFCGWSGLGPVALLIENVLGFDVNGAERTLVWRINRLERHGIRRLAVGDAEVSIEAARRARRSDPLAIRGRTSAAIRLVVYDEGDEPVVDRIVERGAFRISAR